MHFYKTNVEWVNASAPQDLLREKLLMASMRMGDRDSFRGMIRARTEDDAEYIVVVCLSIFKPFQNDRSNAIRAAVSVSFGIPSLAGVGCFGQEMAMTQSGKSVGIRQNVHASSDNRVCVSIPE
jgi:hypothetical protein